MNARTRGCQAFLSSASLVRERAWMRACSTVAKETRISFSGTLSTSTSQERIEQERDAFPLSQAIPSLGKEPRAFEEDSSCSMNSWTRRKKQKLSCFSRGFAASTFPDNVVGGKSIPDETSSEALPRAMSGMYRLTFITGVRRGAGTKARARIILCGKEGKSDSFLLGGRDDDAGGFVTGSRRVYYVHAGKDLGEVFRVDVELADYSIAEVGCRWFLDQVEVYHELDGTEWIFPCRAWLGELGPLQRSLSPCLAPHLRVLPKPTTPLRVVTSAQAYPHPDKVQAGFRAVVKRQTGHAGEDAYFVFAEEGKGQTHAIGVADGVYMWRESGIDAGQFSRALVMSAFEAVRDGTTDVLRIFRNAAERVRNAGLRGSSTFIVLTVDPEEGRLFSANLGDSGFLLLGHNPSNGEIEVKFKSPQQEHEFGYPFQLGHQDNSDTPDDAQLAAVPVTSGDILVVGSDGLFDNLPDMDVINIVKEVEMEGKERNQASASNLSRAIASAAFHNSMNRTKATPYSRAATEAFDMVYSGGKRDDITVVVALLN